jgi:hypothetical protein
MKEYIELLAAIIGLATAVIVALGVLNRTGTADVPVIREIRVFQPPPPPPSPEPQPPGQITTEPTTETVTVPNVVGLSQQDAETRLGEVGLDVQGVDFRAKALCRYDSGFVEETLPPAGVEVSESGRVRFTVCE